VFAWRLELSIESNGSQRPVPEPWLRDFFMRNFTGYRAFDETLVAGDGLLEAGARVSADELKVKFEGWLRGRKLIQAHERLTVRRFQRTPQSWR